MRRIVCSISVVFALAISAPALAAPVTYTATLLGSSEEPANASPATGTAVVTIDAAAHTMRVQTTFDGLLGTTIAAHIHVINGPGDTNLADTVGPVATTTPTFTGFPLGVTSGSYDHTYDTTQAASFNPSFITNSGGSILNAEANLFGAIADGRAYLNIHSTVFTGGEIRGFLALAEVPEPSTYAMLLLGLGLLAWGARRRVH